MKRVFIKTAFFTTALTLCTASVTGYAQTRTDLADFQCYQLDEKGLHITKEDDFAGRGFPKVFAEPSSTSKALGSNSVIAYVSWPIVKQNGFIRILRANGQLGWVAAKAFIPMRKSDGTIGGCTLQQQPNGLITFKLDPGVAIRY